MPTLTIQAYVKKIAISRKLIGQSINKYWSGFIYFMAKIKIKSRFGITPNELLNNKEISLRAKGLYAYIQSKPENWDFSAQKIALQCKENKHGVASALKELVKFGYLERVKTHDESGHWGVEYILNDKPIMVKTDNENNRYAKNPTTVKLHNNSKQDYLVKKNINSKKENREVSLFFESEKFKKLWKDWKEHRASFPDKFKYKSAISEQVAINKLVELSEKKEDIAIQIILQSIGNGWKGFFKLKKENNYGTKQSKPDIFQHYTNILKELEDERTGSSNTIDIDKD